MERTDVIDTIVKTIRYCMDREYSDRQLALEADELLNRLEDADLMNVMAYDKDV